MKKVIVIGATSGIGKMLALHYAEKKCKVGITGRRIHLLDELKMQHPEEFFPMQMDVTRENCLDPLEALITEMEGMDLLIINSGTGYVNQNLDVSLEMETISTNVMGFTRIISYGFNYFKKNNGGHISVIASVAGIRSLRMCPSYSSSKRYNIHFVDCLAQKAHHEKLDIKFTTILPGFIRTDLLKNEKYPLMISVEKAGKLIFQAIEKKKRKAYIPIRWMFVAWGWKLIPKFVWERFF